MQTGETGPNGGIIDLDEDGNLVEWVQDTDDETGESARTPIILRRSDESIGVEYMGLWDKVWWNRHETSREKIEAGEQEQPPAEIWDKARAEAKRIERQYGLDNLVMGDFEYGVLYGRMSALAWVMGTEWEDAGST